MSAESDLIKLYSARILALAADMPRTARLSSPTATAKRRSPLCGSTVTVDIQVNGGVITDYAQDVKACALGQAAAALVGSNVIGLTPTQVQTGRDAVFAMLKDVGRCRPPLSRALTCWNRRATIKTAMPRSCWPLTRPWMRWRRPVQHNPHKKTAAHPIRMAAAG